MSEPSQAPRDTFVAVSETLRERGARSWLGDSWPRRDLLWLVLLTAIGAMLRLQQLEQWSLSPEEALTWRSATESLAESHGFFATERSFHPLGYVGLRMLLDGGVLPFHGEGWLRLPFAFFGILTVPLLGLVGDLFVGRRAALVAALLLAIHPWHVQASQSATAPAIAMFFALLAAGTAWVGLRMRHVPTRVLAAALVVMAGLAHPTGWFVGLAWLVWLLGWLMPAISRPARLGLGVAGLGLVLGIVSWACNRVGVLAVPGDAVLFGMVGFLVTVVAAASVPLCLLAVVGLLLWRDLGERDATTGPPVLAEARGFLLASALVPIGVPLLLTVVGAPADAGHALPVMPWLLLLASAAALRCAAIVRHSLAPNGPKKALLAGALIPAALGLGLAVDTYLDATVRAGQRADWRGAHDAVLQAAATRPGFTVLAGHGFHSLCYYLRPNHWREPIVEPHPNKKLLRLGALAADLASGVARAGNDGGELFAVMTRDELDAVAGDAAAAALLERMFRLIDVRPCALGVRDETIYVYRRITRP